MTDLFRRPATEIAQGVRDGTFSAVEVADAHIARLDQVNPAINAVVQDGREEALEIARQIDQKHAKGEVLGPLAGIPCTVKVNADQAGFATTNGLTLLENNTAMQDSPFVANMRAADAVFLGRTNTPAFSLRWFTKNKLHGQTKNPRDFNLTPGGSSGGAAAAVAAGICTIAHGTDIAGSIRYPAYACGVHGLRPSFGRVPTFNETSGDRFIGAQVMAVSGPIARTISDIALALSVMSGTSLQDPWHVPVPINGAPYAKRAALCLSPDGMAVAADVKDAMKAAARVLEQAGWSVEEVDCPPLRPAARINAVLWVAETQQAAGDMMAKEDDPDALFVHEMMTKDTGLLDQNIIMAALRDRAGLIRQWEIFLNDYLLLICPVSGELPFEQQSDVRSETDFFRIYEAQLTQRALPVMGMPALSVATGTSNGAPLGVQLVSGRFREDILLAAGAEIEASMPPPEVADLI